jgi:hypothetical protein
MTSPGKPRVVLALVGDERDASVASHLAAGGVFVEGCALAMNEDCDLVVRAADGATELAVAARVVWVDGNRGVGLQLLALDDETKRKIATMATGKAMPTAVARSSGSASESESESESESGSASESASESESASASESESASDSDSESGPATDDTSPGSSLRDIPRTLHDRLRGLTLAQQGKLAQTGETQERIVLERLYGKHVWDALLHNPRLTGPEVARIARMGALPRTQIELILNNGAWLQIPEVRRALLGNPRLGTDQIARVLRLVPKAELKLASIQTAYPLAVRDAAKKLLRDNG